MLEGSSASGRICKIFYKSDRLLKSSPYAGYAYWCQLSYASIAQNLTQYPQAHLRKRNAHPLSPLLRIHFYGLAFVQF